MSAYCSVGKILCACTCERESSLHYKTVNHLKLIANFEINMLSVDIIIKEQYFMQFNTYYLLLNESVKQQQKNPKLKVSGLALFLI